MRSAGRHGDQKVLGDAVSSSPTTDTEIVFQDCISEDECNSQMGKLGFRFPSHQPILDPLCMRPTVLSPLLVLQLPFLPLSFSRAHNHINDRTVCFQGPGQSTWQLVGQSSRHSDYSALLPVLDFEI